MDGLTKRPLRLYATVRVYRFVLESQVRAAVFVLALTFVAAPVAAGGSLGERLDDPTDALPQDVKDLIPTGDPGTSGNPVDPDSGVGPSPQDPNTGRPGQVRRIWQSTEGTRATVLTTVGETVGTVTGMLPADPVDYLNGHLQPVHGTADEIQVIVFYSETPPQDEAPTTASATMSEIPIPTEALIMAGATAAAAAAIAILWIAGSSGSVASGAASASGAGGKLAATDLKRLLPFASPLFTRFEKDTVLGHPKREALYALILQAPGVSLQSLCDSTGLSRTAVTHHLRLLELQHLIVSKRLGRSRHYYENGGRFGRDQKEALAILQNPRSKEVAAFVKDHPGAIQKVLCQALALQPSIAHWHLQRLQQALLIEAVRHGRTVSYFPGVAMKGIDQPVIPLDALAPLPTVA